MAAKSYSTFDSTEDDKELLKRSKRTRNLLITIIVFLIFGLGGLGYLGLIFYNEAKAASNATIKYPTDINNEPIKDIGVQKPIEFKKTSIPDLVSLFGYDIYQAEERLAPGFKLVRVENIQDNSNPAIVKYAVLTFTPELTEESEGSTGVILMPTESIYASLNADGLIIDIYYICDLRLLDYPVSSFEDLLANDWMLLTTLETAGIVPHAISYTPPNLEDTIIYDNVNSVNRKIIKQTHIFSGRIYSDTIPTAWTLTVNYDYGAGVETPGDFGKAIRTITIKLA